MPHTVRRPLFIAVLAVCAAAAGLIAFNRATIAGESDGPPSTPESIQAGQAVFAEYCSGCHGRRADGRGPQALNLVPKPQNLRNTQFVRYLSNERMYSSISGGVRGTAMPPFELTLTPEKRWNVIHYIRSLTADDTMTVANALQRQEVPAGLKNPVPGTASSVERGQQQYRAYCASCHGTEADGKGALAANLTPAPRNLAAIASWGEKPFIDYMPDSRLFDSITNGVPGTSMQPWLTVLPDEDRWHIINFLRSRAAAAVQPPMAGQ